MDYLKIKIKSWDFIDSIDHKKYRCASKSQRYLIKRIYRTYKKSAKIKVSKEINKGVQEYYLYSF